MTALPVRLALEKRRTEPFPSSLGSSLGCFADRPDIISIHHFARHAIGLSALSQIIDTRGQVVSRVFTVEVVLADEDRWGVPNGSQIQGLVEGTDVGGSVAEERYRDTTILVKLCASGQAYGNRDAGPDNGKAAIEPKRGVGEMHRATFAMVATRGSTHDLRKSLLGCHPSGQHVAVSPVRVRRVVAWPHGGGDSDRHRLLALAKVSRSRDQAFAKQAL